MLRHTKSYRNILYHGILYYPLLCYITLDNVISYDMTLYKNLSLGLLLLCRAMSSCLGPVVVGQQAEKILFKFLPGWAWLGSLRIKPPVDFLMSRNSPSVFCCCAGRCHHAWARLLLGSRLKRSTTSILSRTLRKRTCRNFEEQKPCSRRYASIKEGHSAFQGVGKSSCTNFNRNAGPRFHTNDEG